MSTSLITSALIANKSLNAQMSVDAWAEDELMRGEKIALFREYLDGDHRANLTAEMRKLLRVADSGSMSEFNVNYMPRIVWSVVNRLHVSGFDALSGKDSSERANDWIETLTRNNRFDALQNNLHDSAIGDGETFMFADWDNEAQRVRWVHEPAYDGVRGLIPLYPDNQSMTLALAVKIWHITTESGNTAKTMRVNVYYPDRIEKFIAPDGGNLEPFTVPGEKWPAAWTARNGTPLGVPIVPFPNRSRGHTQRGRSDIEDAVPLQDALNRLFYSTIITAELTAFRIVFLIGFDIKGDLTPGVAIPITREGKPLKTDDKIDVKHLPEGDLSSFLATMNHVKQEIAIITDTPAPELMARAAISGETLKQLEVGLLGKVKRFQVRAGNGYEDLIAISRDIQNAFGNERAPGFDHVKTRWKDGEIRNTLEALKAIKEIRDDIDQRTRLELIGKEYGWDAKKIQSIMDALGPEQKNSLATLLAEQPDFSSLNETGGDQTAAISGNGGLQGNG